MGEILLIKHLVMSIIYLIAVTDGNIILPCRS